MNSFEKHVSQRIFVYLVSAGAAYVEYLFTVVGSQVLRFRTDRKRTVRPRHH